jgi:hypothetical protein
MYSWNGIHSYHPLSSAFLAQIWEVNGHSKKLKPDGNQLMIIGDYILPTLYILGITIIQEPGIPINHPV